MEFQPDRTKRFIFTQEDQFLKINESSRLQSCNG